MISTGFHRRPTIDDYPSVWARDVQSMVGDTAPTSVRLSMGSGDSVLVELDVTESGFAGWQLWFTCPGCGARRGRLVWLGTSFGCRSCSGLRYGSQARWRERAGRSQLAVA